MSFLESASSIPAGGCCFATAARAPLSPKAFQLLELLLDRRPEAVAKTELLERLWPETFVSDASLHNLVAEIRAALGDAPRAARYIRTVPRYGYAFHGDARPAPGTRRRRNEALRPASGFGAAASGFLSDGANVVGRDRDCAVRIDSADALAPPRPDRRDACGDDDRGSGQQERNTGERSSASRSRSRSKTATRSRSAPSR